MSFIAKIFNFNGDAIYNFRDSAGVELMDLKASRLLARSGLRSRVTANNVILIKNRAILISLQFLITILMTEARCTALRPYALTWASFCLPCCSLSSSLYRRDSAYDGVRSLPDRLIKDREALIKL